MLSTRKTCSDDVAALNSLGGITPTSTPNISWYILVKEGMSCWNRLWTFTADCFMSTWREASLSKHR